MTFVLEEVVAGEWRKVDTSQRSTRRARALGTTPRSGRAMSMATSRHV